MNRILTPELKLLKEEFDFLHKKIGELMWEQATIYYGKKAVMRTELDMINDQIENYSANMDILIEKIKASVHKANQTG